MRNYIQRYVAVVLTGAMLAVLPGVSPAAPLTTAQRLRLEYALRHRESLNQKVLDYANAKMGTQDGNGECWTLADDALRSAGARTDGDSNYVFGTAVSLNALTPGDVLQFEGVYFKAPDGSWNSMAHHTAIVYAVRGRQIELAQQNVNGDRRVQTGWINLDYQTSGTLTAYQPQAR